MPDTKDDPKRGPRLWRPVDPTIWVRGRAVGRLEHLAERVLGTATFVLFASLVVIGPFVFILSVFFAYSFAGTAYFGPTLWAMLAVLTVGLVVFLERAGYAKHFEHSEYRLTKERLVALPLAFLMTVSVLLLFYLVRIHAI